MASSDKAPFMEITVPCNPDCLKAIREFVQQRATGAGFDSREVGRLVLAVDEASSNIIKHSYRFETSHKIVVGWREEKDKVVVELKDDSPEPYLPSSPNFDLPTKVKYRHANGYGRYLIQRVMDDVVYETTPGSHNRVSLIKHRGHSSKGPEKEIANPYETAMVRSTTLRNLLDLGETLAKQKRPEDLIRLFLYTLLGTLTTRPVAFLVSDKEGLPARLKGHIGLSRGLGDLALPAKGLVMESFESFLAGRGPVLAEEVSKRDGFSEEKETLAKLQAILLVPVFSRGKLRGIVSLGSKKNQNPFTDEEMTLVTFLGRYVLLLLSETGRTGSVVEFQESPGADFRGAVLWAMARVNDLSMDHETTLVLKESSLRPHLEMDEETLQKIILTLLTHILYLTDEGAEMTLKLASDGVESTLFIEYCGMPVAFEKGMAGYNPLIDQLIVGGMRLSDAQKRVESSGGRVVVLTTKAETGEADRVSVGLTLRSMKH